MQEQESTGAQVFPAPSPSITSGKLSARQIRGDLAGGLAASMVALPHALGMGTLVFMPLGPQYVHFGIVAGLYAAIAGGFVAALVGSARYQISGPRASTSVILASFVAVLAANPLFSGPGGIRAETIATLVFLAVFLGGALQMLFAWLRLGRALKFIPHPVLAGFMYGIALLILIQQIKPLLGLASEVPLRDLLSHIGDIKPLAIVVGAVTVLASLWAPRISQRIPAPLAGLVAGIVVFMLLREAAGSGAMGEVLHALPAGPLLHSSIPDMLQLQWATLWPGVAKEILTTAFLLAIVGSVETLLSAAMVDASTGSYQDGDRALLTQGASNLFSAALGGVFTGGTNLTVLTNYQAGGRTALSGATHSLVLLCLLFAAGSLVAHIPLVVLAGIMITVALGVVGDWTRDLVLKVRGNPAFKKDRAANLGIVLAVGAATAFFNIVAAVTIGVFAATILLIVRMSTSIVYRVSDGAARASLKVREERQATYLRTHGREICVVELGGYVFFGTADRMRTEVDALARGRKVVILDFRRVFEVEASGARVLQVLGKSLAEQGIEVVLSHVHLDEPLGHYLLDTGVPRSIPTERWFTDLDSALEWAEDRLLARSGNLPESQHEIPLARVAMFEGLSEDELDTLCRLLTREDLAEKSKIFGEGDRGDRLYVIAKGEVSIKLRLPGTQRAQRLATFGPGMVFGEMALIEGKPRSADAYLESDAVLYSLSAADLDRLRNENAPIAIKIMANITRQLAARLRATSEQLRNSY